VAAFGAAGCGSPDYGQTGPSGTFTESFAGTVNPGGGTTHLFSTVGSGKITATLTAVGDDNTRVVGLSLGNWNGTACNIAVANDTAFKSFPLVATVSAGGSLCARVYDSKGVPDATTYTLEVVHP
jgi:hypothetical protein